MPGAGKVPIKKTIVHKGKTITVTYWVNPDKAKKHEGGGGGGGAPAGGGGEGGGAPASGPAPAPAAPAGASPAAPGPKMVPIKKTITTKSGKKMEVTYHVSEKNAAKHQAKEDAKKAAEGKPPEAKAPEAKAPEAKTTEGHPVAGQKLPQTVNRDLIKAAVKQGGPSAAYDAVEHLGGDRKLAANAVSTWASSSTKAGAVKLRGAVMGHVAGHDVDLEIDHIIRADKGLHNYDKEGVRSLLASGHNSEQLRASAHAMAAVSQAMHGQETVTLYRGIGGKTAEGLRQSGALRTGALVSFAETYDAASKFGSHVVAVQVPRSSIVISHRAFAGPGGLLKHEKEVVIATHGKMTGLEFVTGPKAEKKLAVEIPAPLPTARSRPGRRIYAGLPVVVEHPAGSIRFHGDVPVKMLFDYGFVEGYLGADGDELDCYLGPDENADHVHVVHQLRAPSFRAHDEDKIMLGFPDADSAKTAYLAHRNEPRAYQGMTIFTLEQFKGKLRRRAPGSTTKIRARALAALRRRPPNRKAVSPSQYHERLRRRAQQLAARALAPYLAGIVEEIRAASSPADARRRVLARYKGHSASKLADLVGKTDILGHLSGRFEAIKEV